MSASATGLWGRLMGAMAWQFESLTKLTPLEKLNVRLSGAYLSGGALSRLGGLSFGIPGLASITRKDSLALSTQRMARTTKGGDFQYLPVTYVYPSQGDAFQWDAKETDGGAQMWITKPSNDSCGTGIEVHSCASAAHEAARALHGVRGTSVISEFIKNPFLIHGHKWDMRMYAVLVAGAAGSPNGIRSFLYYDGLVRFAAAEYEGGRGGGGNLTNYSLNSEDGAFVEDEEVDGVRACNADSLKTHKWSLESSLAHLPSSFRIHEQAGAIIARVAASANVIEGGDGANSNSNNNKNKIDIPGTYELVGLDVMFDEAGKLWLLEVQSRPSLGAWSGLDGRVKSELVDSIALLLTTLEAGEKTNEGSWTEFEYKHAAEARNEAKGDGLQREEFEAIMEEEKGLVYESRLDQGLTGTANYIQ